MVEVSSGDINSAQTRPAHLSRMADGRAIRKNRKKIVKQRHTAPHGKEDSDCGLAKHNLIHGK